MSQGYDLIRQRPRLISPLIRRIRWTAYRFVQTTRWVLWLRVSRLLRSDISKRSVSHRSDGNPAIRADHPMLSDPHIRQDSLFNDVLKDPSSEYILDIRQSMIIEPKWGYVLSSSGGLVPESVQYSEFLRSPGRMAYFSGLPSIVQFLRRNRGAPPANFDMVVSLRFPYRSNYYHFLLDILPRLTLLNDLDVPRTTIILLDPEYEQTRYVHELLSRAGVVNPIHFHTGDFIEAQRVILVRANPFSFERVAALRSLLSVPGLRCYNGRRLLLSRSASVGRSIDNIEELGPVLKNLGIDIVDTEDMSVDEQIDLFQSASLVVSVHGAGLANLIFCDFDTVKVLEIFLPHSTPFYFAALCEALGIGYSYLIGLEASDLSLAASVRVDPHLLDAAVTSIMRDDRGERNEEV